MPSIFRSLIKPCDTSHAKLICDDKSSDDFDCKFDNSLTTTSCSTAFYDSTSSDEVYDATNSCSLSNSASPLEDETQQFGAGNGRPPLTGEQRALLKITLKASENSHCETLLSRYEPDIQEDTAPTVGEERALHIICENTAEPCSKSVTPSASSLSTSRSALGSSTHSRSMSSSSSHSRRSTRRHKTRETVRHMRSDGRKENKVSDLQSKSLCPSPKDKSKRSETAETGALKREDATSGRKQIRTRNIGSRVSSKSTDDSTKTKDNSAKRNVRETKDAALETVNTEKDISPKATRSSESRRQRVSPRSGRRKVSSSTSSGIEQSRTN